MMASTMLPIRVSNVILYLERKVIILKITIITSDSIDKYTTFLSVGCLTELVYVIKVIYKS